MRKQFGTFMSYFSALLCGTRVAIRLWLIIAHYWVKTFLCIFTSGQWMVRFSNKCQFQVWRGTIPGPTVSSKHWLLTLPHTSMLPLSAFLTPVRWSTLGWIITLCVGLHRLMCFKFLETVSVLSLMFLNYGKCFHGSKAKSLERHFKENQLLTISLIP